MKKILDTLYKHRETIFLSFVLLLMMVFLIIVLPTEETKKTLKSLEEKTFDLRQRIIADDRKASDDIVIISVDDPSYEYLIETFGDWPIPRHVYADILEYVQSQNPKYVAFDLIFIKSLNRIPGSDKKLADAFNKYQNTYAALNFDDYSKEMRKPQIFHEKFSSNVINNSANIIPLKYTNSRIIMEPLVQATDNLGHINITKTDDGVIRSIPLVIRYPKYDSDTYEEIQDQYYLYMT